MPKNQRTQNNNQRPELGKPKDHRTENDDHKKHKQEPRKPKAQRTYIREQKVSTLDPRDLDEDHRTNMKVHQKNIPERQRPKKLQKNGPRTGTNRPSKNGKHSTELQNNIQQEGEPKENRLESAEAEPSPEPEPLAGLAGEVIREDSVSGEDDTRENTVPGAGGQEGRQPKEVKPGRKKGYLPLPGSGSRKGRKGGWRGRQGGRRKQGRVAKSQE